MKRLLFIISILLPMTIAAQDATFRDMRRDTSTRGVDFSVKLIGSPGGDVNLVGGSDYIRGALGGEVTLGYRVNKAFTGFTSAFIYMKVNFKEKPKFTPYVSLNFGYDVLSTIADGLSERGDIYVDDPCYFFIITPAGGLDFPLKRGGTAFVEARFDYGVSYQYLPSVAVGYTF